MTDIIDLFMAPTNIARMNRVFGNLSCNMPALMREFIHHSTAEGIYDLWTGTDADLYLNQMNDEFIAYMKRRFARPPPARSARMEYATYIDPFMRTLRREDGNTRSSALAERLHERERLYKRCERDRASVQYMAARDDEASDAGQRARPAMPLYTTFGAPAAPFDYEGAHEGPHEGAQWRTDPTAGSGEAQYHLLELDAQISLLNRERILPIGYGNAQEQLADDARIAARYADRVPEMGVIPKSNFKRLNRVIAPDGRVTLDDDYDMARDIFSRDSKGYILVKRH